MTNENATPPRGATPEERDAPEASVLTGSDIERFRCSVLAKGLALEIRGLRRRGRSCYTIIKEVYGLRGSRQSVLDQFIELLRDEEDEPAIDYPDDYDGPGPEED